MEVELPDSKRTELDEFEVQLQIWIDILDFILVVFHTFRIVVLFFSLMIFGECEWLELDAKNSCDIWKTGCSLHRERIDVWLVDNAESHQSWHDLTKSDHWYLDSFGAASNHLNMCVQLDFTSQVLANRRYLHVNMLLAVLINGFQDLIRCFKLHRVRLFEGDFGDACANPCFLEHCTS